jgi:DNA (cytosine-5)-methyltransferase 1
MIHFSLFSGIGGFDLASEWMGWKNYLSCEINEFGNKILEYYWADAYHHRDIHTLTYETIDIELSRRFGSDWRNDDIILTGGFPCQPYSMAGKRLGKEDERHLFPEMLRVIQEVQPKWIVGENVLGIVNWSGGLVFEEVQADLEAQGYEVQSYVLPAAGVGSCPHRRDRVWFVAYSNLRGRCGQKGLGEYDLRRSEGKKSNNHLFTTDTRLEQGNDAGTTPNPHSNSTGTPGESTSTTGNRSNINVQPGERGSKTELNIRPSSLPRDVADTDNNGLQGRSNSGELRSEGKEPEQRLTNLGGFSRADWQNFPTQSPVCNGNDGLSSRLDSITFSKWRNESIKGGGNAIVPQVVYQIFKSIEQYELSQQPPASMG